MPKIKLSAIVLMGVACALLLAQDVSAEASFNFEISKRTENTIRQFMSVPHIPNTMTKSSMSVGLLSESRPSELRQNFFAQLKSFPTIYMIYAGFETGYFSGYFRKTDNPVTYQYTWRGAGTNDTRLYWWADGNNGDVEYNQGIQRSRQYDPRLRGWYMQTKEAEKQLWSSIYIFASSNQLGLTACEPLIDSNGNLEGVLAVDYTLGDIDKFLTSEFSAEGRAVFLVEKNTGYLVGSSTLDPILRVVKDGEDPQRVKAVDSRDELVKTTSVYLESISWPEGLRVHAGRYIQVREYSDPGGLSWYIVVVMPSSEADDYVQVGSPFEAAILAMVVLGLLFPVSAGVFVFIGRKKVIWKAAQPPFLILFAFASALIPLFQLAFLGPNTAELCNIRPWLFNLGFTLMFSVLFVKVHRVSLIFNNSSMKKVKMGPQQMLMRVAIMVFVEMLIQMCWSLVDPNRPTIVTSTGAQGEYVERTLCASSTSTFSILAILYKGIIVVWGCVLAWKTRNIHGAFAESKALMLTMYNIAFVGVVVLCLYNLLDVNGPTKVLVQSFGVLWVTLISTILVYGPRTFQLIMKGDIDMKEVMRQQTMMTSSGLTTSGESDTAKDHTIQNQLRQIQSMKEEVSSLQEKLREAKNVVKNMDIEQGRN
jgi:hypothetical protein